MIQNKKIIVKGKGIIVTSVLAITFMFSTKISAATTANMAFRANLSHGTYKSVQAVSSNGNDAYIIKFSKLGHDELSDTQGFCAYWNLHGASGSIKDPDTTYGQGELGHGNDLTYCSANNLNYVAGMTTQIYQIDTNGKNRISLDVRGINGTPIAIGGIAYWTEANKFILKQTGSGSDQILHIAHIDGNVMQIEKTFTVKGFNNNTKPQGICYYNGYIYMSRSNAGNEGHASAIRRVATSVNNIQNNGVYDTEAVYSITKKNVYNAMQNSYPGINSVLSVEVESIVFKNGKLMFTANLTCSKKKNNVAVGKDVLMQITN